MTYDEVVVAVTRGGVNATGSRFSGAFLLGVGHVELGFGVGFTSECYVFANHQQRRPIDPRVTRLQPLEGRAWEACDDTRARESAFFRDCFDQIFRDDVDLFANIDCRIIKVRINGNAKIGWKRPRGRGPDQHEHRFSLKIGF